MALSTHRLYRDDPYLTTFEADVLECLELAGQPAVVLDATFLQRFVREYKLIVSKNLGDHWVLAANAVFEQEWEQEDGETEKESVLEFTLGAAYRFTPNWSPRAQW